MPDCPQSDVLPSACRASLRLRFELDAGTSRLVERAHRGPLRVQKALYPEGPRICHAIVVHPPGGVVGGDQLLINAEAGAGTHAFITTPGAAKWYRANGQVSRQDVHIAAGAGAAVEWMPQETIFFNGAHVVLSQSVDLDAGASYIGAEILCFGRRASGESFGSGTIRQCTQVRRGGTLLWWEQGVIEGGTAVMRSPFGLAGASVCATLLAVGAPLPPAVLATLRAIDPLLGLTQMKSVLVGRYLGDDSEAARTAIIRLWQALRPALLGCAAPLPRIWNT